METRIVLQALAGWRRQAGGGQPGTAAKALRAAVPKRPRRESAAGDGRPKGRRSPCADAPVYKKCSPLTLKPFCTNF